MLRSFSLAALAALMVGFATPAESSPTGAETTLIVNALVVDGTGAPARKAAVRLNRDRIAEVGNLAPVPGELVVDAKGRALAPGFIDTHSHHDRGLSEHRDAAEVISQGITTIVVGQDGHSATFRDFVDAFAKSPASVNVASYIGHNTVREVVMSADFKRAASAKEIARMRSIVRAGMQAGALGLSTGLEYDPGIYSTTAEIAALAREVARMGGRYATHLRSEDRHLWEAVEEAIEIGRAARLPVHISHMKIASIDSWGQAPKLLARLERARREGIDVTADVYPYAYWQSTLSVLFPERNFGDRAAAEFALRSLAPAEGLRVSRYAPDPTYEGKTVAEIAGARAMDPVDVILELLARSEEIGKPTWVIGTSMDLRDVGALVAWPHSNICSDGGLQSRHPRGAGSFTRVLRTYVRERGLLALEEAVRKMSGAAAMSMGIADRGIIRPGAYADLVLFDPATVTDRASIEHPSQRSVGVDRVWVNGRVVWEEGRPMSIHPGRAIRRSWRGT